MKYIIFIWLMTVSMASAKTPMSDGHFALAADALRPGASFELTGNWLYQPGYNVATNENPQNPGGEEKFLPVPVPQLLNRIYWWLDDSEDFKQFETERLKKLGFDTERAEDGWYRLWVDLPAIPRDKHIFLEFDGVA